jgi:hypothetical protein
MFTLVLIIAAIIASEVVVLFTPLIVLATTELVKFIVPKVNGLVIVMLIVPALSIGVTLISDLVIDTSLSFWVQAGTGLLAVFFNQLYKQFKELGNQEG